MNIFKALLKLLPQSQLNQICFFEAKYPQFILKSIKV